MFKTDTEKISGWHHGLDGRESEWTPGDGDGQGGPACCDPWGRKKSDTTEWLNWTEQFFKMCLFIHLAAVGLRGCMWTLSGCGERASHCRGFPSPGAQALGAWASVAVAPGLSSTGSPEVATGSATPQHVGSSWTRDWSNVPCITRWLLNHWATREAHGCNSELSTYRSLIW